MTTKYKVRDKVTKKFWNGDIRRSSFSDKGKLWGGKKQVESAVAYYVRNHARWAAYYTQTTHNPPKDWEIVEIKLVEQETGTESMTDFLKFVALKEQVEAKHYGSGYFLETMHRKGVLDKIQFLFKLKPADGNTWVDMDRIKECRAQLRQLGVMTRSYRESNGYFGMMDRDQAMKARLVLDVDFIIDLEAIRASIQV